MTTTTNTINLALDVADATIADLQAKLAAALEAAAAASSAPAADVTEVEIHFADAITAPQAAHVGRATVYEAATLAAEGQATRELYQGARGVLQTVRHSDVGGSLHLIALNAAFYGTAPLLIGDAVTAIWLQANGRTAAGFPNWRSVNSANVALNRLAHAGLVERQGNGVGARGQGYIVPESFFRGAATALVWEEGAIVRSRLYVAR